MVSKNLDEPNIRTLFQSYGLIEDCTVLRDASGKSRGTREAKGKYRFGQANVF